MMNDDRDLIDLNSTQNWSQLDVKRELDNREVDETTGKKYDFARGFSEDKKEEEDKILLDGLTSGLNYIPEEFLMAADAKHEQDMEAVPEEEKPDVSWAYRTEKEADDEEPFVALADIKEAEQKAAEEKLAEIRAAEKRMEEAKAAKRQAEEERVEELRKKNLEAQAEKIAKANESDELVQANIEARKLAREAAAVQMEAELKAKNEAQKEAQRQAEIDMYKELDIESMDVKIVSKEERIAAANKNRHNVTEEIEVPKDADFMSDEAEEAAKNAEKAAIGAEISKVQVKKHSVEWDTVGIDVEEVQDAIEASIEEMEETVEQVEVKEKELSTGDTGIIYFDEETFEELPSQKAAAKAEKSAKKEKAARAEKVAKTEKAAKEEAVAAFIDGEEVEEEVVRVKKKKKKASASEEYASWADDDEALEAIPVVKKKKKKKKPVEEVVEEELDEEYYGDGFVGKVVAFFKNLSGLDMLVMGTGILVVLAIIITVVIYSSTKATQNKIAEFDYLGQKMQTIGVTGGGKLVAVADSKKALLEVIEEEPEVEEEVLPEYQEKDDETEISVTMTLTSMKKDLKIKFINAKTKKLVGNKKFKVNIEDSKGKKTEASDDDMDGIIYIKSMEPGKAKVSMGELGRDSGITYSREAVTVTIKENLDYKKVDVSDEVKTESEVNAKKEDTAQKTITESTLADTVEWVESTKTLISAASYAKVKASKLDNIPKYDAKANFSTAIELISDLWCLKVVAACEDGKHNYSLWKIDIDPTCTEEGLKSRVCEDCGEEQTKTIAKIDHQYDDDGICIYCGASEGGGSGGGSEEPDVEPTPEPTKKPKVTPTPEPSEDEEPTEAPEPTQADPDKCKHTTGDDGVCTKCGQIPSDAGTVLTYNGKPVYLDEKGEKQATYADYYRGVKTYYYKQEGSGNGDEYFYTGWQEIDGNTYFFDKNGNKVTGEQVIQGAKYNFDSTGALVKGSGTMGIDVSKWNGNIDWKAVKNSGVSFVIIRCGYRGSTTGALIEDPKFRTNIKGATDAGLKVGIYFFSQATSDVEAVEEASMTIDLIKGYKISYPVFLDVEDSGGRGDRIDSATRTAVITAYCQTLKNSGYTAGVYANKSWLETKMNVGALGNFKIWLAQYNAQATYKGRYDMWQYSSKGSVKGIGGNTDMNLSYLGY